LEQSPEPGECVKSGHIIYVTINSPHSPTITLPDVIDNSSLREAMAKLTSMGFKLGTPQYISGEKDWVYGILVRGHHVVAGDKISIEDALIIQVGNGMLDESDSVNYVDPEMDEGEGDVDEFEEVPSSGPSTSVPSQTSGQKSSGVASGN
jgi:beta-lactam-binding protein with PASTA domain